MQNLSLITSYGNNFIKINNTNKIVGNIVLFSDGKYNPINDLIKNIDDLNIKILSSILDACTLKKDIFLVGCGKKYSIPDFNIRAFISKKGFSLEWMTTKSAISTWNLLLEDFRNVVFIILWD